MENSLLVIFGKIWPKTLYYSTWLNDIICNHQCMVQLDVHMYMYLEREPLYGKLKIHLVHSPVCG